MRLAFASGQPFPVLEREIVVFFSQIKFLLKSSFIWQADFALIMGSSKKHKDKDREHKRKRKHRSRSREREHKRHKDRERYEEDVEVKRSQNFAEYYDPDREEGELEEEYRPEANGNAGLDKSNFHLLVQ